MAAMFDNLVAYKIVSMLLQPFTETDAYKLGIIDADGNNLIPPKKFKSSEQKDAYNQLTKMVFIVKQMMKKTPMAVPKLKSILGAFSMVKEAYINDDETIISEENLVAFIESLKYNTLIEETLIVEEVAATNTAGISGLRQDDVAVRKKKLKAVISRLK